MVLTTLIPVTAWAADELPEGWAPCSISELSGSWTQVDGKNNIAISFVTPTQMTKYDNEKGMYVTEDMTAEITKIVLQRSTYDMYNYRTIKTFENPAKGVKLEFTDEGLNYGKWDYNVLVYVGNTTSDPWDWNAKATFVAGQIPAGIDNITSAINDNTVTLSFTVPETDTYGNPLNMDVNATVTEIVFSGMMPTPVTVKTVNNVAKGQPLDIEIQNVANGSHYYTVTLSTAAGDGDGYGIDVFVGKDKPGSPENITAAVTDEGVVLTWEAPMRGEEGGDFGDPSDLTYNVYRKTNQYEDGVKIASAIKALTFTDNINPDSETLYIYDVEAVNAQGASMRASSQSVVLGPASSLPYIEGFNGDNGNTFDHGTTTRAYSGNYCTWYVANSIYVNDDNSNVTPYSGTGLAYAMYSNWFAMSQWDAFTTGNINFADAVSPTCSFYLYDISNGGSDMKLKVQTSADGTTFDDAYTMDLGKAETTGWVKVTAKLPTLRGAARGQVRICSVVDGKNIYPVVIDELLINDDTTDSINAIGITNTESTAAYNLQGQRVGKAHKGLVIINGKKFITK